MIVADVQTPVDYLERGGFAMNEMVHFLSVEEQEKWGESGGAVGAFVRAVPWRHFARKNLGYLYAIQRGAEVVFDFDDDNILDLSVDGKVVPPLVNDTFLERAKVIVIGKDVLNHHDLMGASVDGSWPRGFPLELVQDATTRGQVGYGGVDQRVESVGVMQLCADVNPDIDAIHRLVKPLPMRFRREERGGALLVPSHALVPYNAQATLHTAKALWAILLPRTVPGRVSDIWRGYFAQVLFRDLGLSVALVPPIVTQDRNQHEYLADMDAELDLYFKAGKLVEFLNEWNSAFMKSDITIPARMERLWIALYERGYIELEDVRFVQLWLAALEESGYSFPMPLASRKRHDRIVLMGQFNYANQVSSVMFWAQKWRAHFKTVVVYGPFSSKQLKKLNTHGISAYQSRNDSGFYSPMENLKNTLQQFKSVSAVDAVLYIHDDALMNVTNVLAGIPASNAVIVSRHPSIAGNRTRSRKDLLSMSYTLHPGGWFSKIDGTYTKSSKRLKATLRSWPWTDSCMKGFLSVYKDPKTRQYGYLEEKGNFLVPPFGQSDFMLISTSLADEFSRAAQLMLDHQVFLECAVPKIVDLLARVAKARTRRVSLCTEWRKHTRAKRGTLAMIEACTSTRPATFAVFHPYKLNQHGLRNWSQTFDWVSYGIPPAT